MSDPSPRSKQRRDQATSLHRQEILDAAEFLFGTQGYAQVTMEHVAERCLFSRRTLYRYFPTKEVLAGELTLQALVALLRRFQVIEAHEISGLQWVQRLGQGLGAFALECPLSYQSLRLRWFVGVPDEAKRELLGRIVALNRELEALMVEAIAKGQRDGSILQNLDAPTMAVTLMGSSAGLLDSLVTFGPSYAAVYGVEPSSVWESHLALIERGLGPSS